MPIITPKFIFMKFYYNDFDTKIVILI